MYTSMLLLALALVGSPTVASGLEASVWQKDYSQARKLAGAKGKPLAVFVAPGKNGWNQLAQNGQLGKENDRALADHYVRVFIDSRSPEGQKLAADLGMKGNLGIVVSDRSGELMAFFHEGSLPNAALTGYLHRYADLNRVVQTTETNPSERTSYYPPQPPVYNFGGGGSC